MTPRDASPPIKSASRSVKSAERVLDLLEYVAGTADGVGFVELGRALGIPKSSLYALLEALTHRGYLEFEPAQRRYRIGVRNFEAGQAFARQHDLVGIARQTLRRIVAAVNETAQLARLSGRDNVYLVREDSTHALRLQSETGTRLPAHATGIGKALLSGLAPKEIAALFGDAPLPVQTPTTIGTVESLQQELARTRERGFAVDCQEYTPGVFCFAVPIVDADRRVPLAISISVPVQRASRETMTGALPALAAGSLEIARATGVTEADGRLAALSERAGAEEAVENLTRQARYSLPWG